MKSELSFGEKLKKARIAAGLTQRQLADLINAKHNSVSNWEHGQNMPDPDTIVRICEELNLSATYLLQSRPEPSTLPENVQPISELPMHRIPMIGEIAAGQPIFCEQDYETVVPGPMGADFALTVRGDSMEPTYLTGDIVYLRQQDDVDDGQVAAVIIDNEATLKHVYHIPNGLTLVSDNTAYPPRVVTMPDYDNIRILGLVIGYTRMYNRA